MPSEIRFTGSLVFDELSETDFCSHVVRRHNKGRQPSVDRVEIGSPGGWRAAGSRMWLVMEVGVVRGRAWRLVRFGAAKESIELREMTWEPPTHGRLLIRVRAAGAGYPDVMMAAGQFPLLGAPPFGLGEEAAGEVVAVPAGSRFAVGDQVAGITAFLDGWGGYAEYAYLREQSSMRIPPGITDAQAAGFPIAFRTAYAALVHRVPVSKGQRLVVLGAAGSSGVAALQLGRARGAEVIAVAGSPEKTSFCLRLGADHAINYRTENVADRLAEITGGVGVDVVFDPVGHRIDRRTVAARRSGESCSQTALGM